MAIEYVYMDYNATTPLDPEVLRVMMPYLTDKFGNASSTGHIYGLEASAAVDYARKQVASLINAAPEEIIFTSGATESVNLALKGYAEANFRKGANFITTEIEHSAVTDTCRHLERNGLNVKYIKADKDGLVNPVDVLNAIDRNTILVSVMSANNEIGTIQPVAEIGDICRQKNIAFHTDAAQAAGKIRIDVKSDKIDLMSFSAHKIYGPKGIGALYISKKSPRIRITEQINGGGHEFGFRSGTLNVPAIAGFGKACSLCSEKMNDDFNAQVSMRDRLIAGLQKNLGGVGLNGHPVYRLPNNASLSFHGINAVALIRSLKSIACSTGSACTSATLEPSRVLKAIGKDDSTVRSSVRFGIGRFTTDEEIDFAVEKITNAVKTIRENFIK